MTDADILSADGNVLIGQSINPQGQDDRWIVVFNTVPEPSSFALAVLGALGLFAWKRGRLARRAGT